MSDVLSAEDLARRFHEAYERLAPEFGYKTRPESRTTWEEVPDNNRALMVAVCSELLAAARASGCAADLAEALRRITTMPWLMSSVEAARIARDALSVYDRAVSGQTAEKEEALRAAEQALVDLHESLFIASERGATKTALGSMASFAKAAALAAASASRGEGDS